MKNELVPESSGINAAIYGNQRTINSQYQFLDPYIMSEINRIKYDIDNHLMIGMTNIENLVKNKNK